MRYIKRHLESVLENRFQNRRAVYVFGARQTGKTTLLRHTFPNISYLSLENPSHFEFATKDPIGFLNQFSKACILDEAQRIPILFSYLQEYIDIHQIKILLTGSQNFLMMESITQSLAGRLALIQLPPLSQSELRGHPNMCLPEHLKTQGAAKAINALYTDIVLGFFPEVCENPAIGDDWYSDYIQTFVERDIRRLINVKDTTQFQRFLSLTAGRAGQILNITSLASDIGISPTQCNNWLTLLEQSGIIYRLPPYYNNFNKRIIKTPKLYFCDTGLLCHLLRIHNETILRTHPSVGAIVENYVINEIRKAYLNDGKVPELYFFRDSNGNEVDLILMDKGHTFAIEIKSTQTLRSNLFSGLQKFQTLLPESTTVLIYGGQNGMFREGVHILPIGQL